MNKSLIFNIMFVLTSFVCCCNGMKSDTVSDNYNKSYPRSGMILHIYQDDHSMQNNNQIDTDDKIDAIVELCQRYDDFDLVAEMLNYYEIDDLNTKDKNGDTLLTLAAYHNCKNVAKWLLLEECDANIKNNKGETAKDIAMERGHMSIVDLLTAGVKRESDCIIEDLLRPVAKEPYHVKKKPEKFYKFLNPKKV